MAKMASPRLRQTGVTAGESKLKGLKGKTRAQQTSMVRVATISLPGAPARSYEVSEEDDADTAFVHYKKEMGIRATTQEPNVVFQMMPTEAFASLHDEQRGHFLRFGQPAQGNLARSEVSSFIDRDLTEEQKEYLEDSGDEGDVIPKGTDPRPLSDRDGSDQDVDEQGRDNPQALRAMSASDEDDEEDEDEEESESEDEDEEEEDEEEEEVEVDPKAVKKMKLKELRELGAKLGIKKADTLEKEALRKKILKAAEG